MENKNVGYLILGISVLIVAIIFLFDSALKEIVAGSCGLEHSLVCPMNQTIAQQTYLALGIAGLLIVVGLVLIFSKPSEKIIIKKVEGKYRKKNLQNQLAR